MHVKRTLVALLVGAIMFGSIYALAASLTVTSATLGAGNTAVAACQSGTVNVTYSGNTYGSTSPAGYKTTTVTLNGLDETASACGGKAVKVTLTGASNASLGEGTGTLPTGSGTTYDLTISGVSASDVTGVHVLIAG